MNKTFPGDSALVRDHRAELELRQREDEERRRLGLAEQTSPINTPEARIRIWEQRHHLTMPKNPEHNLIGVIAGATALTRAEVLEELRQRAQARSAPPPVVPADPSHP